MIRPKPPYPDNLLYVIFNSKQEDAGIAEDRLHEMLSKLRKQEQEIILYRYKKCFTYKEIGEIYHRTGARIQQIHSKALRKLKVYASRIMPTKA